MAKELVFVLQVRDESGKVITKTIDNVNELKKAHKDLSDALEKAPLGSAQWKKLKSDTDKAGEALEQAKQKQEGLSKTLQAAPGIVGTVSTSIAGLNASLKALLANPWGAVIAGLVAIFGSLFAALKKTEAGMFALNRITAIFSGAVQPLLNLVQELAVFLAEGLATALETVASLFALGGREAAIYAQESAKLADALNKVEEAEGDLAVERSRVNRDLAEARAKLQDDNVTLEERKRALEQVRIAETDLSQKEVNIAKERARIKQQESDMDQLNVEKKEAAEEATIALNNAETSNANTKRLLQREANRLAKEEVALTKARRDAIDSINKQYDSALSELNSNNRKINEQIRQDRRNEITDIGEFRKLLEEQYKVISEERKFFYDKERQELKDEYDKRYNQTVESFSATDDLFNQMMMESLDKEFEIRRQALDAKYKLLAREEKDGIVNIATVVGDAIKQRIKEIEDLGKTENDLRIQQINDYYDSLKKVENLNVGLNDEIEAGRKKALLENEKLFRQELFDAQTSFLEATTSSLDDQKSLELRLMADYYDQLIALEEEGSGRQSQLRLSKAENLLRIEKEFAALEIQAQQEKLLAYAGIANSLGQVFSALAGDNKEVAVAGILIEKFAAIASIASNTAIANAKSVAASPLTLGMPWVKINTISAIASSLAVAAQAGKTIADIYAVDTDVNSSGSENTPVPATKFAKGGLLKGPSHAQGGILTPFGELEGGEFITNKFATQAFLPMLEEINRIGQSGPEPMGSTSPMPNQIIKTYVVASEMDSALEKRKKLQDLARL